MAHGADRVELGVIGGAHGVRGAVRVRPFTAQPEDIAAYGPLAGEDGERRFSLTVLRVEKGQVIARIDGVEDRDAAAALKGTRLFVARDALPQTDPGTYYQHDLIGLAAVTPEGAALGTIRAVQNFGAGDLLEIDFDGRKGTDYVPFTQAFVPDIRLEEGRAVVALPEDFFKAARDEKDG